MDMAISSAADHGNMRDVYLEAAKSAERSTERFRRDGFAAEIVPDTPARWHIVVTQPAHERIAASHLIARRFGVYLPERDRTWVVRGRVRRARMLLYPNYLFLFVWDIERHLRRIHACTGVARMLMAGERPAVVPDSVINEIQAIEFNRTELPADWRSAPIKKRRPRRRRAGERAPEQDDQDIGPVVVRTYNALVDIDLDPAERISELHKALSLPS